MNALPTRNTSAIHVASVQRGVPQGGVVVQFLLGHFTVVIRIMYLSSRWLVHIYSPNLAFDSAQSRSLSPVNNDNAVATTARLPSNAALASCRQEHRDLRNPPTHFLFATTFVMACLITVPAFSISFFVNPTVTQTFSAGCACHP